MAQGHGERLTSLDASFLHMETPTQHMHVGGVFIFDGENAPNFEFSTFVELVRSRLHLVPRYRQRLAYAPLNVANPVWVDDRHFDLGYHVRHAALPAPGTMSQLMEYAARIFSRQLDRDKPLWELYVIEGLEDGRFAVLGKNHHAMIDGVSGVDIATVMLDFSPDVADPIPAAQPWEAEDPPSGYELAFSAARDLITAPKDALDAARRVASTPTKVLRSAFQVSTAATSFLRANVPNRAPRSPLNVPPGLHRRFAGQRIALEDVKYVKNVFGTTVNDVVLAIVADATGRYLRSRNTRTDGMWLKAMVPVSVRAEGEQNQLGNKVASVFVSIPMFEMDPIERLETCHEAMKEIKGRHHAVGADFLIGLQRFAAPTIQAAAARLSARARMFNFLVTNVPGPQIPIYCLGAQLLGAFPFTPLSSTQAYAVGVLSLSGYLNFGFTADYDALPDIQKVTGYLVDALDDLKRSAEATEQRHELVERRGKTEKKASEA